MIVKLNGQFFYDTKLVQIPDVTAIQTKHYNKVTEWFQSHRLLEVVFPGMIIPTAVTTTLLTMPHVFAATTAIATVAGGTSMVGIKAMPLIKIVQDLGLPVAVAVALWGLIEKMLGNASGGAKVKTTVVCYVGMFIIPLIFYSIHDAFI
jgi:hypothetical protein